MRYTIIANPVSGLMTPAQKRAVLAEAGEILAAPIHGLDTRSSSEFRQCARDLAGRGDVLVVAGGDGTFSDIINAVDTSQTPIAYLPLGTGNAMRHALHYRGSLTDIARRIRDGKIHEFDLINCEDKRRAFLASIGIEGVVIRLRDDYLTQGYSGFKAYFRAVCNAYRHGYKRPAALLTIDGVTSEIKNLLSLIVVKQPYYGFGMNVVPQAKFDDRQLHILCLNSNLMHSAFAGITAFVGGNRSGRYQRGRQLSIKLDRPLLLQVDGNTGWEADSFHLSILPKALKIRA